MPELPEAETIVRGLARPLRGATVRSVEILQSDVLDTEPQSFASQLAGARIRSVGRRGKNLVLALSGARHLVVNLGMSGRLLLREPGSAGPPPTHPAVRLHLEGDRGTLVYHDIRRFGRLGIYDDESFERWSASLGPEPLDPDFTATMLEAGLRASTTPLRSWLLDQRRLAGVGNIYANEAAFLAGVHPRRRANTLSTDEAERLHRSLRQVLRNAVKARGTTLRDYRTAQGWKGEYSAQLCVYARDGKPCPRCGETVRREVFSNRSAFYCPSCQPAPGAAEHTR